MVNGYGGVEVRSSPNTPILTSKYIATKLIVIQLFSS